MTSPDPNPPTLLMREMRFENGLGLNDAGASTGSVVALEFFGDVLVDGERLVGSSTKVAVPASAYSSLVNSLVFHGVNSDLIPRTPRLPCPIDLMYKGYDGVDGIGWQIVLCGRRFGHAGYHAAGRGWPLVWSDAQAQKALSDFDDHAAWYSSNRSRWS